MPNVYGGSQSSEDYAPHLYYKRRLVGEKRAVELHERDERLRKEKIKSALKKDGLEKCFFCDIQDEIKDKNQITENQYFFSRYSDFPVSKGHSEIAPKNHIDIFSRLRQEQVQELWEIIKETRRRIQRRHHPDGYNFGWNMGITAGQTLPHFHVHIIPRYQGDVENPRGGIRNILSGEGDYTESLKALMPEREQYLLK